MLTRRFRFIEPTRPYRELRILSEISHCPTISQRALGEGALLGATMVNRYISEMQRSGLVEVRGNTNRSFRYGLTSAGEYRRDELFFQASKEIVQFYGLVKQEFQSRLQEHAREGARKVVLYGAAETAEIVLAASEATDLEVVGIVDSDPEKHGRRIGSLRVSAPEAIREMAPDTVLITSFGHADEIYEQISGLETEGIRISRA